MDDVRRLVDDKRTLLQARGYFLVEIWECEWQARKETDDEVAAFVSRLDLYHPDLPYRHQHKLTFPLRRTCVQDQLDRPLRTKTVACAHTDEQRFLIGTWCTPELEEAVRRGYRLPHVHEI